MFTYVKENGKRWANLVKILKDTRNEHSVKNKFNSIVRKHRKISASEDEPAIYDEIIERIRNSIANRSKLEN